MYRHVLEHLLLSETQYMCVRLNRFRAVRFNQMLRVMGVDDVTTKKTCV